MPEFGYSFSEYDPLHHIRASAREIDVSPKAAREVCVSVKGLSIGSAKQYLEDVVRLKKAVAFRRHKGEVGHKRGLPKFHAGRYPAKTAKKMLELLRNIEANAEFKGMNADNMIIVHAAAHRGRRLIRYIPRAMGRSSPSFNVLVHMELVATEA